LIFLRALEAARLISTRRNRKSSSGPSLRLPSAGARLL